MLVEPCEWHGAKGWVLYLRHLASKGEAVSAEEVRAVRLGQALWQGKD